MALPLQQLTKLKAAHCGHKVITTKNNWGRDSEYAHYDTEKLFLG